MRNGYNGKILHVDLTDSRWWVEEPDELIYRTYLGGSALSSYFLLRDLKPGIDPLGPENMLIVMTSVINGLPLSGANRYSVAGKSPLTGGYGEAEAGGYWGPELKRAGFDGIIVHGKADKPVYLYVHDGECEIRDAAPYWGKVAGEVQDALISDLGDNRIRVLQTGIAGEKLVRYAAIVNELRHFHGRAGLGAVMGSKNLKAIVARGRGRIPTADSKGTRDVLNWFKENYDHENDDMHAYGTSGGIPYLNFEGILPTRNFNEGTFEYAEDISGQKMADTILTDRGTCFSCTIACKREVEVPERGVEARFGGMEYETIGALGSVCGVGDLAAIAEGSQWVNQYVLDSISTGMCIAFAMECYENGLLTKEDTDGLELNWGNAEAMVQLVHKIGRREGIGDLLAEGAMRAAQKIGQGAEQYALTIKGQELPMHEPRGKKGLSLSYALSPTGADHMEAPHDPSFEGFGLEKHSFSLLGLNEPVDRMDLGPKKVRAFFYTQTVWDLFNSVGMCVFVGVPGPLAIDQLQKFVNAATGWDMSAFELMKVGERTHTMSRLFNQREGFGPQDDTLPDRLFTAFESGPLKGEKIDRDEFAAAVKAYYQMAGWDDQGVPLPGKLAELELDWVPQVAQPA